MDCFHYSIDSRLKWWTGQAVLVDDFLDGKVSAEKDGEDRKTFSSHEDRRENFSCDL